MKVTLDRVRPGEIFIYEFWRPAKTQILGVVVHHNEHSGMTDYTDEDGKNARLASHTMVET